MLLFQQMLVLFAYMLIGYVGCKKGKIDEAAGSKISWLVVNIATPMMIISTVVNGDGKIEGNMLLITAVLATLLFLGVLLFAQFIPLVFKDKENAGELKLMTLFSNVGFMGFPLIQAAYGNEALLYGAIFLIPYNILLYTYGVHVVDKKGSKTFNLKKVLNSGVIACFLAIVIYLTGISVPGFVKSISLGLSNLNAPLSMIVIGISLTKNSLKELFCDLKMLGFAFVKLIIVPVAGILIVKMFVTTDILLAVSMVMLATPCGALNVMMTEQGGGNYEMVSKGVALTTLLSVITIPIVSMILGV